LPSPALPGENPDRPEDDFLHCPDMSDGGVTRLRTIGEALRSAREAQGKSLDDAAVATRIRSSYLEALEREQFGELGGGVYAKGFLRSYAGYLGVDPAPLLEAYRAQETPPAPVFEHVPRAIGGLGTGRRGPNWLLVAIVCVSIILLVSLWGLLRPAPDPAGAQPPFVTTPAPSDNGARAGAAAKPAPPATARPAAGKVTLTLRYAGASWTRVTADGRVAFEGTPAAGQRRSFTASRSLELVLGYPAGVRLTVNGRDLGVPDRSGGIWRHAFTPASRSLG
jgi:cytoskeleton protein RodZ